MLSGGGASRPLPRDGGVEELHTEIQQSGHSERYGPEIKNRSSAKDGAPERLRCGTIQKEVRKILQMMSFAGAARRILLPFYPA